MPPITATTGPEWNALHTLTDAAGPLFISAFTILFGAITGFITLYAIAEVILLLILPLKRTRANRNF